jgi:hypothetical protein
MEVLEKNNGLGKKPTPFLIETNQEGPDKKLGVLEPKWINKSASYVEKFRGSHLYMYRVTHKVLSLFANKTFTFEFLTLFLSLST